MPEPDPQPKLATRGISCARCGYDLRATSERGLCPECGLPVRSSLGPVVQPASPATISLARSGSFWMMIAAVAGLAAIALPPIVTFIPIWDDGKSLPLPLRVVAMAAAVFFFSGMLAINRITRAVRLMVVPYPNLPTRAKVMAILGTAGLAGVWSSLMWLARTTDRHVSQELVDCWMVSLVLVSALPVWLYYLDIWTLTARKAAAIEQHGRHLPPGLRPTQIRLWVAWIGFLLILLGFAAYVLAFDRIIRSGWLEGVAIVSFFCGIAFWLIAMILHLRLAALTHRTLARRRRLGPQDTTAATDHSAG